MLKSSLCDYSDAYILVKGKITITGEGDDANARHADKRKKGVAFKNCAPFTNCKSEINNTEIESFKSKIKITGITPADGNTKDVQNNGNIKVFK